MDEINNSEEQVEINENLSSTDLNLSNQDENKEIKEVYHCQHCGNVIDENNKFCTFCGKRNTKPSQKKENIKYLIAICSIAGVSLILSFISIIINLYSFGNGYYYRYRVFTITAFTFAILQFIVVLILGILDYLKCDKKDKNSSLLFLVSILSISLALTIRLGLFLK